MKAADLEALQALPSRVAELERRLETFAATEPLLNVRQAATFLGITPAALRASAYRGSLPCVRVGRRLRFRASELARG